MPDLATLAQVKSWLGITGTTEDATLTRLITSTSEEFLNEIRRADFSPEVEYTEALCGNGHHSAFLAHYPINSITSLTIYDEVIPEWSDASPTTPGWFLDDTLPPEDRQKLILVGMCFPLNWSPNRNVVVVYKAGYSTVPPSVTQAVIEWIAFKRGTGQVQSQNQTGGSVTIGKYSESGANASVTLDILKAEIPADVQRVIDQYARPVI